MKDYPKILYVRFENEGTEDEYLNPHEEPGMLADRDEDILVAQYRFDKIVTISNKTVVRQIHQGFHGVEKFA